MSSDKRDNKMVNEDANVGSENKEPDVISKGGPRPKGQIVPPREKE